MQPKFDQQIVCVRCIVKPTFDVRATRNSVSQQLAMNTISQPREIAQKQGAAIQPQATKLIQQRQSNNVRSGCRRQIVKPLTGHQTQTQAVLLVQQGHLPSGKVLKPILHTIVNQL